MLNYPTRPKILLIPIFWLLLLLSILCNNRQGFPLPALMIVTKVAIFLFTLNKMACSNNPDFTPREGGVWNPTQEFSLVNQDIQVTQRDKKSSFHVRFPNIWISYKLPKITDKTTYDNWLADQMIFWQMQLNFDVWYATTGCGIAKEHFNHPNRMTRSVFRFHAYYQIGGSCRR